MFAVNHKDWMHNLHGMTWLHHFNQHTKHLLMSPDGAMQGQRGTFGFHEQGESTRLKIYFYVTAI